MSDDPEAELLDAIRRDPFDEEARLVYADWLEERGDLRGEYLRLELELHRLPPRIAELEGLVDPAWLAAVGRRYCVVLLGGSPNKIGAIKLVREFTGLGLKDAKDLVDSAEREPATIVGDLDRQAAHGMAKRFDGVAPVRIEPRASEAASRQQLLARPNRARPLPRRPYRAVLVSIGPTVRMEAIRLVRERAGQGLKESRDLVDTVLRGTAVTLRSAIDASTAAELAVAFAGVGEVRIEADSSPVRS